MSIVPGRFVFSVLFVLLSAICTAQTYDYGWTAPAESAPAVPTSSSVALNSAGELFVADATNGIVLRFGSDGQPLSPISSVAFQGSTIKLRQPSMLCLDVFDQLYIYDAELKQVLLLGSDGATRIIGGAAGQAGQISNVRGIAADSEGYLYVLNGSKNQVDVYTPQGHYLTWISGYEDTFSEGIAIGINPKNELYVLSKNGPSVFVYDIAGNLINSHRNLSRYTEAQLKKVAGMAVLPTGNFLLLDAESGVVSEFNKAGDVTGSFGSRGTSSGMTFGSPRMICASLHNPGRIAVLDESIQRCRVIRATSSLAALRPVDKHMRLVRTQSARQPMYAMTASKNGHRYVIPAANRATVIAYRDTTSEELFAMSRDFEEAGALATDSLNNLYVIDSKNREVVMFNEKGVFVRKFGKETRGKLKEPSSIVIQSGGKILVADEGDASLKLWNSQGVFQKVITSSENTLLRSPHQIALDSKGQIYVWDDEVNCVFRIASSGWPVTPKQLRARSPKGAGKEGVIGGFFIDQLDHIHLYNATTGQIEVYSWDLEPILKFTAGSPGNTYYAFGDVMGLIEDPETFTLYLPSDKGSRQTVFQLLVKPPPPAEELTFDWTGEKLLVVVEKVNNRTVSGYGLLTTDDDGKEIVVAAGESPLIQLKQPSDGLLRLRHYGAVSLSNSDRSDPNEGFDDYLHYGEQLLGVGRYDEAISAFHEAVDVMKRAPRVMLRISSLLNTKAQALVAEFEIGDALKLAKYAVEVSPDDESTRQVFTEVLNQYFTQLANNNDVNGILIECERLMVNSAMKPLVLTSVDQLAISKSTSSVAADIEDAVFLSRKVAGWDPSNPKYAASLAATSLALYRMERLSEAPRTELEIILNDAEKNARQAVNGFRRDRAGYVSAMLLYLQILNTGGKYAEAEKQALNTLTEFISDMSSTQIAAYRTELAMAYAGQGGHDAALEEYRKIARNNPTDIGIRQALAGELIATGKYDEARAIYQELAVAEEDNAGYIAQIGRIELMRGNYAEASFQLEKAISRDPSERSFYGPLAEAFEAANNNKKALENYRVAIQYEESRLNSARNQVSSASELDRIQKQLTRYRMREAQLLEKTGNYTEAVQSYRVVTFEEPSNAEAYYGLGKSCLSAGLVYDALNAFQDACRLAPANVNYLNARDNALELREKVSVNQAPVEILEVRVKEIFPSLYRNYADVNLLPLGEAIIANNTTLPITPTSVTVFIPELMQAPTEIATPAMVGYSNSYIKLSALFTDAVLNYTNDTRLQLELEVKYTYNGQQKVARKSVPVLLRSRNAISWADKRRLSAFISPNETPLVDYTKKADVMFRDEATLGMNRNVLKAIELYTLLGSSGITYSPDPVQSFAYAYTNTEVLDFLQFPTETMKRKAGDCDDLVALYASLLENSGIPAAYIDVPGHVFLAFDLQILPADLEASGFSPKDVVVAYDKVWLPLETTMLGTQNFMTAWTTGASRYYRELSEGRYPELVPLSRARSVYLPSSFIPDGFVVTPESTDEVLTTYRSMVSALVDRTRKEKLRELEIRYKTESSNVFVKNKYATLLAQSGDFGRAERILREALELAPGAAVLNNLGNVYYLQGKVDEALNYYLSAAEADPSDGEIRMNICRTYLQKGDKPSAREAFDLAVSLNPSLSLLYDELKNQLR